MWWLAGLPVLLVVSVVFRVLRVSRRAYEQPKSADAIVVFGARVFPGGVASGALEARIDRAVELFHQGLAPCVVVTGGSHGEVHTEASVGAQLLERAGVPTSAIVVEPRATNTTQNAEFVAPLLNVRGAKRVLLVTDDFHGWRAAKVLRRQGFDVQPIACRRRMKFAANVARELISVLSRPSLWL